MEKVYVIMSHSGTRISKFIHFFTHSEYTHVSICLDDSFKVFYSFARRNVNLPIFSGIIEENSTEGILGIYDANCVVYELSVTKEQKAEMQRIIDHMLENPNLYTYNFIGCPLIFLGIPLKRKHHFTCTQFVAYILEQVNINILPVNYELAKPQDFFNCGRLIYTGKVKQLNSYGYKEKGERT